MFILIHFCFVRTINQTGEEYEEEEEREGEYDPAAADYGNLDMLICVVHVDQLLGGELAVFHGLSKWVIEEKQKAEQRTTSSLSPTPPPLSCSKHEQDSTTYPPLAFLLLVGKRPLS